MPETNARLPCTRTQLNEILIPGGTWAVCGSTRPNSSSRCSIRTSAASSHVGLRSYTRRPTNHVLCGRAAFAAWPRCSGHQGRPRPRVKPGANGSTACHVPSLAVPLACHAQRPTRLCRQAVSADCLDPRTGQRSKRSNTYSGWFAGNLLATDVAAGSREGVCAGGRDRFRTCGLCRVKSKTAR